MDFNKNYRHHSRDQNKKTQENPKKKSVRSRNIGLSEIGDSYTDKFLKLSVYKNVHNATSPENLKKRALLVYSFIIVVVILGLGLGLGLGGNSKHGGWKPPHPTPVPSNNAIIAGKVAKNYAYYAASEQQKRLKKGATIDKLLVFKSPVFKKGTSVQAQGIWAYLPIHNLAADSFAHKINKMDDFNFWYDLTGTDFTGNQYKFRININLNNVNNKDKTSGITFADGNSANNEQKILVNLKQKSLLSFGDDSRNYWSWDDNKVYSAVGFNNEFNPNGDAYNNYLNQFPQFHIDPGNLSSKLVNFSIGTMSDFKFSKNFVQGNPDGTKHSTVNFLNQVFSYANFNFSGIGIKDFPSTSKSASVVSLMSAEQMYTMETSFNKDSVLTTQYHFKDSTDVYNNQLGGLHIRNPYGNNKTDYLYDQKDTGSLYYYNSTPRQYNHSLINDRINKSLPNTSINSLNITNPKLSYQYIGVAPQDYYDLPLLRPNPRNNHGTRSKYFTLAPDLSKPNIEYSYSAVLAPFVMRLNYLWVPQNGKWQDPATKWALALVYSYTGANEGSGVNYHVISDFTSTDDPTTFNVKSNKAQLTTQLTGYSQIETDGTALKYFDYKTLGFLNNISTDLNIDKNAVNSLGKASNLNSGSPLVYWTASF